MNRASRIEKSFYLDSNLYRPDRKRRLHYENDQNLCSSSFVVVGRSSFAKSRIDKFSPEIDQPDNATSGMYVPSLDLHTSFTDYDYTEDVSQSKTLNRRNTSVLANEPYHRSWTSIDRPYQSSSFDNTVQQERPDSSQSSSAVSQNDNTLRAGTPLGIGQVIGTVPSTPTLMVKTKPNPKTAASEKTVTFSTKTPDILCTGRGDTFNPRSNFRMKNGRNSGNDFSGRSYECVPPYGTSNNSINCSKLLCDQFVSSPTKAECYNKRNESQIFSSR